MDECKPLPVDHLTAAAVVGAGDAAVAVSLRAAATVIMWSGVFKAGAYTRSHFGVT